MATTSTVVRTSEHKPKIAFLVIARACARTPLGYYARTMVLRRPKERHETLRWPASGKSYGSRLAPYVVSFCQDAWRKRCSVILRCAYFQTRTGLLAKYESLSGFGITIDSLTRCAWWDRTEGRLGAVCTYGVRRSGCVGFCTPLPGIVQRVGLLIRLQSK